MSEKFRNPYHFVPLAPHVAPPAKVPLAEFDDANQSRQHPHLTHDRYVSGTHSGRITCRVKVETPLICGNEQTDRGKNQTKLIHPFEIEAGMPALPASALRGMLSALAEAASQSALKVLKGDVLSYRRNMGDESKLSAIGLVVQGDKEGELRLRPLALPTMEKPRDRQVYLLPDEDAFADIYPVPAFKVYLGNNPYQEQSFLDDNRQPLQNVQMDQEGNLGHYYGMKLREIPTSWERHKTLPVIEGLSWQRHASKKEGRGEWARKVTNPEFLIGRKQEDPNAAPVPWKLGMESQGYTRGIYRGLGLWTKERKETRPPRDKYHELFIPYTEEMEKWASLRIPENVIHRFNQLADQRTDDEKILPFEPLGTRPDRKGAKLRLKLGDVVYFRPEKIKAETVVAEVSFSSIWRGRVETADGQGADTRTFFAAQSPDLLPLHPGRRDLTLAEQLFGVVESRDDKQKKEFKDKPAFALASRLRVSHGVLMDVPAAGHYQPHVELLSQSQKDAMKEHHLDDYPLKNLASPKPPSPALYFRPKSLPERDYIPKKDLSPASGSPLGRKFYLRRRHPEQVRELEVFVHPDRFKDPKDCIGIFKQHQSVKEFVRPGCEFEFHLDFDNLSALELQLLVYVLTPTPIFRHQIGHGKPLGLGQMEPQITQISLVDRQRRYAADALSAPRYHHHWSLEDCAAELEARLQEHRSAFRTWAQQQGIGQVLAALELLGTPPTDDLPIHYPQTDAISPASPGFEKELFKWFVENEKLKPGRDPEPQYLASLWGLAQLPSLRKQRGRAEKATPRHSPQDRGRSRNEIGRSYVSPTPAQGMADLKGQNVKVKVMSLSPKVELLLTFRGQEYKGSLTPQAREYVLSKNPPVGEEIDMRVKSYTPGNLQLDQPL